MDAIEVRGRRTDGSGRWFLLRFELRPKRSGPLVSYATEFSCDIEPADALAETYDLENWKSGIVSATGFAVRRTPNREWGVELTAMEGKLASSDMNGLVGATTIAAFRLNDLQPPMQTDCEWDFETRAVAAVAIADARLVETRPVASPASVT